jgi:carbon storage regulator
MLIVSRRKGQRIIIGDDIEVIVTEISRSSVKIGIQAPPECTILRGEVHEAIERANREAVEAGLDPAALQEAVRPARGKQPDPARTASYPSPALASEGADDRSSDETLTAPASE